MTNAQEFGQQSFMKDISKSDYSGGSCKNIDKKSHSHLSDIQIRMVKKIAKKRKKTKRNDKNDVEKPCDTHILTERARRAKMNDMFTKLHALFPQLPPKADKSTIVDEAVRSIKSLEQTLQKLHNKKLEKLHYSSSSNTTSPITLTYVPSSSPSPSPTTPTTPIPQIAYDHSNSHETFLADQISSSSTVTVNLPYPCNDPITTFDTWSSPNVVLNICGNEAFFNLCCPKEKSGVLTDVCYLFEKYNIEVLVVNISSNVYRRTYMIQAQVNQLLGDGIGIGEIFKQAAQELVLYVSSL